jgi:CheY-like chemotaxis protein
VLVIEDEDRAAELISHHLTEAGYRVARASSSDQAVTLARTLRPDAITLDMFLPDAHGNEVLSRLGTMPETRSIPVVVVSISSSKDVGMALGAKRWIVKPIGREELVAAMADVLEPGLTPGSVLVVDDDSATRELVADLLESRGYRVHCAENGARAIELARSESPSLILLDLVMPGVSGFEVVEELREWRKDSDARIVVFTNLDLSAEETSRLRRDVEGVVSKGGGGEALLRELARITASPDAADMAPLDASSTPRQEVAS